MAGLTLRDKTMTIHSLSLWSPAEPTIIPKEVREPIDLVPYAKQLSRRDQKQILQAFEQEHYEIATTYIWGKAMVMLKKHLAPAGTTFLSEMLSKDISESENITEAITDIEAIRLAEELGIVNFTEAIRLRHTQELISHFSQLEPGETEDQDVVMERDEAVQGLRTVIANILGRPRVDVVPEFARFRVELETGSFTEKDSRIHDLLRSPYFFRRLAVSLLLSVVRQAEGAKLERALVNQNVILPAIWPKLRDPERWQVGTAYARVHAAGRRSAMSGLKSTLLKTNGFDYVPENLRFDTYTKLASKVILAHESVQNLYTEPALVKALGELGPGIPWPALRLTISALLAVRLGDNYGRSPDAQPPARQALKSVSAGSWLYYLDHCLPGDMRVVDKLLEPTPRKRWFQVVEQFGLEKLSPKQTAVRKLIEASIDSDDIRTEKAAKSLRKHYYGRK